MPTLIPPVLLSTGGIPGDPGRDDQFVSHYFGPYPIGANLYAVLISEAFNPPPYKRWLNVFKSTNNGLTWTSMDTANRPQTDATCDTILNGAVFTICY